MYVRGRIKERRKIDFSMEGRGGKALNFKTNIFFSKNKRRPSSAGVVRFELESSQEDPFDNFLITRIIQDSIMAHKSFIYFSIFR